MNKANIRSWTSSSSQVLQDMIGDLSSSPEPMEIKLFSPDPGAAEEMGPEGRASGSRKSKT